MQSLSSDEHHSNADLPILESLQIDSNVTSESTPHIAKQDSEINSIEEGIQIERSAHRANADLERIESLHPGSNVTVESSRQCLKQDCEIVSTDEGMHSDLIRRDSKAD
jgi:hypothetical protein